MTVIRIAIWLATAFFVVMLFTPLVVELSYRLSPTAQSGLP
jgi:hypothetical protein